MARAKTWQQNRTVGHLVDPKYLRCYSCSSSRSASISTEHEVQHQSQIESSRILFSWVHAMTEREESLLCLLEQERNKLALLENKMKLSAPKVDISTNTDDLNIAVHSCEDLVSFHNTQEKTAAIEVAGSCCASNPEQFAPTVQTPADVRMRLLEAKLSLLEHDVEFEHKSAQVTAASERLRCVAEESEAALRSRIIELERDLARERASAADLTSRLQQEAAVAAACGAGTVSGTSADGAEPGADQAYACLLTRSHAERECTSVSVMLDNQRDVARQRQVKLPSSATVTVTESIRLPDARQLTTAGLQYPSHAVLDRGDSELVQRNSLSPTTSRIPRPAVRTSATATRCPPVTDSRSARSVPSRKSGGALHFTPPPGRSPAQLAAGNPAVAAASPDARLREQLQALRGTAAALRQRCAALEADNRALRESAPTRRPTRPGATKAVAVQTLEEALPRFSASEGATTRHSSPCDSRHVDSAEHGGRLTAENRDSSHSALPTPADSGPAPQTREMMAASVLLCGVTTSAGPAALTQKSCTSRLSLLPSSPPIRAALPLPAFRLPSPPSTPRTPPHPPLPPSPVHARLREQLQGLRGTAAALRQRCAALEADNKELRAILSSRKRSVVANALATPGRPGRTTAAAASPPAALPAPAALSNPVSMPPVSAPASLESSPSAVDAGPCKTVASETTVEKERQVIKSDIQMHIANGEEGRLAPLNEEQLLTRDDPSSTQPSLHSESPWHSPAEARLRKQVHALRGTTAALRQRCAALEADKQALNDIILARRPAAAAAAANSLQTTHCLSMGKLQRASEPPTSVTNFACDERPSKDTAPAICCGASHRNGEAPNTSDIGQFPPQLVAVGLAAPSPAEVRLRDQVRALRGTAAALRRRCERLEADNRALQEGSLFRRRPAVEGLRAPTSVLRVADEKKSESAAGQMDCPPQLPSTTEPRRISLSLPTQCLALSPPLAIRTSGGPGGGAAEDSDTLDRIVSSPDSLENMSCLELENSGQTTQVACSLRLFVRDEGRYSGRDSPEDDEGGPASGHCNDYAADSLDRDVSSQPAPAPKRIRWPVPPASRRCAAQAAIAALRAGRRKVAKSTAGSLAGVVPAALADLTTEAASTA